MWRNSQVVRKWAGWNFKIMGVGGDDASKVRNQRGPGKKVFCHVCFDLYIVRATKYTAPYCKLCSPWEPSPPSGRLSLMDDYWRVHCRNRFSFDHPGPFMIPHSWLKCETAKHAKSAKSLACC